MLTFVAVELIALIYTGLGLYEYKRTFKPPFVMGTAALLSHAYAAYAFGVCVDSSAKQLS